MNKRSLRSLCALSALACFVFVLLAGCGQSYYFAGRALPPSGILNRVLIAVQNPGALTKGTLEIVDAYYDIRHSFNNKVASFSIAGYSGADPKRSRICRKSRPERSTAPATAALPC